MKDHYTDSDTIAQLIGLGDLSSLGPEIGEAHDFDAKNGPEPELSLCDDWCMAYGRDRGETGTEARTFKTIAEWVESMAGSWCEYFYLFDGQDWIVSNGKKNSSGCFEFDFLEVAILKEIVEN